MKQIVVHCRDGLTEVALIEDRMLVEFFAERPLKKQRVGSVYIGKVVNVLPGMQAAFVDIGLKKNAFLHVDDVLPANLERVPAEKPSIDALLKEGQELIVQMAKEPLGSKGARVTTHISLPGRWIVYMPEADYVGVMKRGIVCVPCRPGDRALLNVNRFCYVVHIFDPCIIVSAIGNLVI